MFLECLEQTRMESVELIAGGWWSWREEEKNRKKQIKKELQERNKADIERIASTIEIQVAIFKYRMHGM